MAQPRGTGLSRRSRTANNVSFVAYRQLDDERTYVLLERYTSREAFAAHRETPHFKELLLGHIVPRLESRVLELHDVTE